MAELALSGQIKAGWFEAGEEKADAAAASQVQDAEKAAARFWLTQAGKKAYIPAWYAMLLEKTLFQQRRIKRKDQVQHRLTSLAQYLMKEFDGNS